MKPLNPVLFPNSGSALVKALQAEAPNWVHLFPILAQTRFATVRATPQQGGVFLNQAIITPTAAQYRSNGSKKLQGYNINLFGDSYANVENLGTALEVLMQAIQAKPFHWLQVNLPAIPVDESPFREEHHRFMTVDGLLMGDFVGL